MASRTVEQPFQRRVRSSVHHMAYFGRMWNIDKGRVIDPCRVGSTSYRARQRRWQVFRHRFPEFARMKVLDLGGTLAYWKLAPVRPSHVTIVNLDHDEKQDDVPWAKNLTADACSGGFGRFDLVVSNSLLEHVGGHLQRKRLGEVVREASAHHWVQTPYRYFPVEPHWVFPAFHWLPFRARVGIARRWPFGHIEPEPDNVRAAEVVASVELVSITEMRLYFPNSELWLERISGLPKSLVAIR